MSKDNELINLAGKGAYERGFACYKNGRVSDLVVRGTRMSASVAETSIYNVALRKTVRGLEGGCDCPVSEGLDFCKHRVAVASIFWHSLLRNQVNCRHDSTS